MSTKPRKPFAKIRRYTLATIGVVAAVGGVAGNLGSIVDLWEKFSGGGKAALEGELAPVTDVSGTWYAEVSYDWGAKHQEEFVLRLEGNELRGTASFLGLRRGVLEGRMSGDRLSFVTRTLETLGEGPSREVEHRYVGRVSGSEIRFSLQSTGGYSEHVPVEFVARRGP